MSTGLILAFVLTAVWVPLFVFRAEDTGRALQSYTFWERFWVLTAPAIVGTHVGLSSAILSWIPTPPTGRAVASVVLCAGGVAFWLWARRAIGPMRVRRLPDEPPERLRRDGPFGMVRNPLYLGTLIIAAAPAIAAGSAYLVFTYALCVIALFARSVQEERRLHAQLGDEYASYCRQVKRLVPYVW